MKKMSFLAVLLNILCNITLYAADTPVQLPTGLFMVLNNSSNNLIMRIRVGKDNSIRVLVPNMDIVGRETIALFKSEFFTLPTHQFVVINLNPTMFPLRIRFWKDTVENREILTPDVDDCNIPMETKAANAVIAWGAKMVRQDYLPQAGTPEFSGLAIVNSRTTPESRMQMLSAEQVGVVLQRSVYTPMTESPYGRFAE